MKTFLSALSNTADWMTSNLLCLNGTKTEFLLLGLRSQLKKIHNRALTISIVAHLFPPQPLLVTFVLS